MVEVLSDAALASERSAAGRCGSERGLKESDRYGHQLGIEAK